jgi:hypothetical protein
MAQTVPRFQGLLSKTHTEGGPRARASPAPPVALSLGKVPGPTAESAGPNSARGESCVAGGRRRPGVPQATTRPSRAVGPPRGPSCCRTTVQCNRRGRTTRARPVTQRGSLWERGTAPLFPPQNKQRQEYVAAFARPSTPREKERISRLLRKLESHGHDGFPPHYFLFIIN